MIAKMYSVDLLKYHVAIFRWCGFWPYENGSCLYDCWSVLFSVVVAIGFPLTQLVCVAFVDSMDQIVEHLVLSSTVVMASVKGFNVMIQKRKLVQMFSILAEMDENVAIEKANYKKIFKNVAKNCNMMSYAFFVSYITSWSILVLQVIFSHVENREWSSTYLYPSAYWRQPSIYWGVLIFQAVSNLILCIEDAAVDTYAVVLLDILGGHIDVLKIQLREFGAERNDSIDYKTLVRFCKNYTSIVRYDGVIDDELTLR